MTRHASNAHTAQLHSLSPQTFGAGAPASPTFPTGIPRYRPGKRPRPAPRPPLPDELQARARRAEQRGNCAGTGDQWGDKPGYMALSRTTDEVLRILLDGDLARVRAESVAEQLGISCTTLRRRLRDDHTSYQFLLDRARQYRCEQLLRERWVPGKCLADKLGYIEVNSFYRAFRRWTGISFSAYKLRQHR